ncbi:MAG: hypothetical protein K2X03_22105 [Bryobacteraceae bacterium]|nr:hypothetical protein [Bryobacteraceae bacterium]
MVSRLLCSTLWLAVLAGTITAATGWDQVTNLPPDTDVRLSLDQPKRRIKGRLVAADRDGITLTLKNGSSQTIRRADLRQVEAKGPIRRNAPLIGALVGAVLVGAIFSAERFDATPQAVLVLAAGGGAAGFGIGSAFRYRLVFER